MPLPDDPSAPRKRRRRRSVPLLAVLLVGALSVASCSDGGSSDGASTTEDEGPNAGALPTLAGGLELVATDPVRVLAGDGLTYGRALPSQQAAADAFLADPEVSSAVTRRIYALAGGRLMGDVLVLGLDGSELFDQGVLDAFVGGVVAAFGDGTTETIPIGDRPTVRSRGPAGTAIGYLEGDQLVVVRGREPGDVEAAVALQLAALATGAPGSAEPRTPLVAIPIDSVFVAVPTVTFQPFPPPEDEPVPEPPALVGATGVQGRYGVVAGERRTTVWAFSLDPGAHPWAESVDAALVALVSARAAGAEGDTVEVLGRLVHRADGAEGEVSARAFRQQGVAVLVEGLDPAQLDAVVSAWITALDGS
ncbi:MAG: hypothetical protein ABL966_00845 [Acidimicrobiales bacterium]